MSEYNSYNKTIENLVEENEELKKQIVELKKQRYEAHVMQTRLIKILTETSD